MATQTAATKAKAKAKTEDEKIGDLLEAAQPSAAHRPQQIKASPISPYIGFDTIYTQRPLSYFPKLDFLRLITKATNRALKEGGMTVAQIAGVSGERDITNTEVFIQTILQLAEFAPELIKDIYLIALGVPRHDRQLVSEILDEPHDDETHSGGLTDEDGLAILQTFIAQNVQVMRDFYVEEMPKLGNQLQQIFLPDPTPES